jgi:glycine betaine/proline transport system substrate-binding protein
VNPFKRLIVLLLVLAAGALATGCGGVLGVAGGKELTLGYIVWDENVAVSNLTKVILEEDLGYGKVELQLIDVEVVKQVFQGVADGDLAAFQDVWMPNLEENLSKVQNDVVHLDPWFKGETSYGIAVPAYMNVRSIAELDEAGTDLIIGIESGAAFHPQIKNKVIPGYNLDMKLVEGSTPAMLFELEKAYKERQPVVFLRWSPHWMNAEYDLRYLKDPKDLQGAFNDPAKISTIVNKDLPEDDPVAYAFLKAISLNEKQLNEMEADINEAEDPVKGVKVWLEDNRDIVQPWIDAAEKAQEA